MDGSTSKVIRTGSVNITGRDGMMYALETVWYVLEAQYNLIFIRVVDKEGCEIQVQ